MMRRSNEKPSYDKPATVIGEDTVLSASKLESGSSVQINGRFNGDIDVKASLVIGNSGIVDGNVTASFILVAGRIEGNVEANQQIHITKTGSVKGDITYQSIVIDEGAGIEGDLRMKTQENKSKSLDD